MSNGNRRKQITTYSEWIQLWRVVQHIESGEGGVWEPLDKSIEAYRRARPGCWVPINFEHQNPYHEIHNEEAMEIRWDILQ